ncbi:hypothetical protein [Lacisediminimonas sp.]|uniref:hypothetical protein n=1 Tax=Lacisediminimonas sp. TaxID=3060582 RepID=UPI002718933B|nr:hypothetical protein [Lacisediminimonas sp.]MDO8301297.1 hypothetical protein [Lacisediminimonas sp.]
MPTQPFPRNRFTNFNDFMYHLWSFSDHGNLLAPHRFADALQMDLVSLAGYTGIPLEMLIHYPASLSVQTYMRSALRVIAVLIENDMEVDCAIFHYLNFPWVQFGFRTAEQIVIDGDVEKFVKYLLTEVFYPPGKSPEKEYITESN